MADGFNITTIINNVDSLGQNYVQTTYQSLANTITSGGGTGVAGLLLTLYVIYWGIGIWQGTATGGPADHAFRLLRAFAIYAMATSWSDFQTLVYTLMNDGPSAIGNSLLNVSTSANGTGTAANLTSVNGVQQALQNVWDTSNNVAEAFLQNAGITNWGPYFYAMVFWLTMAILIAYACFLIILAKLFMWILLAIGPLFILMLLFNVSTRFFAGWLSALMQYFFVQVLVYAFLAFYISLIQQSLDAVNGLVGNKSVTWAYIAPVCVLGIIGILLLHQIAHVAAMLAGGIPMQSMTVGRFLATASGWRTAQAGYRGARALRNPFSRTSTSWAERAEGARRDRMLTYQQRISQSPEFKRLAEQIKNPAA